MEVVSLKLGESFISDMEKLMQRHRYTTKTEFIREAIREKMHALEKEEALLRLKNLYGASKRKTTDAQLHRAREKAFAELEREIR